MNSTASSQVISPMCRLVSTTMRAARKMVASNWYISWRRSVKKPCSRIIRSAYSAQPSLKYGVRYTWRRRVGLAFIITRCQWWPGYASCTAVVGMPG